MEEELERIMDMMTEREREKWERVECIPVDKPRFAMNCHNRPCGTYCYEKQLHWKNDNWNGHTGMKLMMYLRCEKKNATSGLRVVLGLCDKDNQPQSNIWIMNRDDLDYWVPQFGREI